jgi:hypothetical protein
MGCIDLRSLWFRRPWMYRLAPSRCVRWPKHSAKRSRNVPSRSSTARAADTDYKALETGFNKRFSQRWQASATYTLSKFNDLYPQPWSGSAEVPFPVAKDLGNEYGPAEGDQRHRAVFNGMVELPYAIQRNTRRTADF